MSNDPIEEAMIGPEHRIRISRAHNALIPRALF